MKYCSGCEQTKELTEFSKRSKSRDGLIKKEEYFSILYKYITCKMSQEIRGALSGK